MWAESDSRTPMICFLSMGSDPTDNIERLAKSKGIRMYSCDCRDGLFIVFVAALVVGTNGQQNERIVNVSQTFCTLSAKNGLMTNKTLC